MNEVAININNNLIFSTNIYIYKKQKFFYSILKNILDIIIGLFGIILLIPLTIIIKICYLLNGDFNSIFYSQIRIGKNGKKFKIYKFRTMIPDADKKLKELLECEEYKKQWKNNQKLDNDPRITKVGRILRKTSIDEIPQFINLFKNMSLIGPRPLVEGELDSHNGLHNIYESVKPGITGWWACNGRNSTDYDKRLSLEYYYALNQSLLLDVKCIIKTIIIVIKRTGVK